MKRTIVIILASFFSLPVCAEPILNPNNGHYYERITGDITPALQKFLNFYFSSITLISATHRGSEADLF